MIARATASFILILMTCLPAALAQWNLEGGLHGGMAATGNRGYVPGGTEEGGEYGVWLIFTLSDQVSVAADWAFLPQDDFLTLIDNFPVGEKDRNRQYVDITLQYHIWRGLNRSVFAEIGGGSHWNNRDVINPSAIPQFEEAGKESTRSGVWTLGAGFRQRLLPHLHWISQVKVHNPGREESYGLRLFSGLTFSWK